MIFMSERPKLYTKNLYTILAFLSAIDMLIQGLSSYLPMKGGINIAFGRHVKPFSLKYLVHQIRRGYWDKFSLFFFHKKNTQKHDPS